MTIVNIYTSRPILRGDSAFVLLVKAMVAWLRWERVRWLRSVQGPART